MFNSNPRIQAMWRSILNNQRIMDIAIDAKRNMRYPR